MKRTQLAILVSLALGTTGAVAHPHPADTDPAKQGKDTSASTQEQVKSDMRVADAPSNPNQQLPHAPDSASWSTDAKASTSGSAASFDTQASTTSADTTTASSTSVPAASLEGAEMRVADAPSAPNARSAEAREAQAQGTDHDGAMDYQVGSNASVQTDLATRDGNTSTNGAATGSSASSGAATQTQSRTTGSGASSNAYGVLIVPFQVASNDGINSGCWARVYENDNFGGQHLTILGPLDVASLEGTAADDWNGADSIIAGRNVTVTAYDDKNFRNRTLEVGPGQQNPDITGPFEKIASLKVACRGQG